MPARLVRIDGRFWRMLGVKWQRQPLSGQGAANNGGRWNRRGVPALYLATEHATAIAEYHQALVRPGTLAVYEVMSASIADLRTVTASRSAGVGSTTPDEPWNQRFDVEGREPASWIAGRRRGWCPRAIRTLGRGRQPRALAMVDRWQGRRERQTRRSRGRPLPLIYPAFFHVSVRQKKAMQPFTFSDPSGLSARIDL